MISPADSSVPKRSRPTPSAPYFQLLAPEELDSLEPQFAVQQVRHLHRLTMGADCGFWEWQPQGGCQRAMGALWERFDEDGQRALARLWLGDELDLVHSGDRDRLLVLRQRLRDKAGAMDAAFRAYDRSGRLCWLRLWARVCRTEDETFFIAGGCAEYSEAVTERYLSSLSGERPLEALTGINDGIWEWDLRADEVVLDAACWGMLGYRRDQVDGTARAALGQWKARMLPEDYPRVKQAVEDLVRERVPLDVEYRLWHRDGGIVWVRCRGQLQSDSRGKPVRVVGVLQDVTGNREALERVERELERLRRESGNRAELLSSLSHELRTPLNAILGYSQLVEQDQGLNPDQRRRMVEIRKAGQHLLHLVGDVMELARIDSNHLAPSMEPMRPAALVADCRRLLEPLAETRRVNLIFEPLGWENAYICADPVRFKQVVLNLVGNAVKYNRESGRVVINFAPQAQGWLRLSILDTGKGIADERRTEVFEPFNRLGAEKSPIEGTGVGLAIAKRLTEAMGGRIDFDSHEGQGSVFWIEFPMMDAPPEVIQLAPQPRPSLDIPPCRLLHIDGRPSELTHVRALLAAYPQVQHLGASDAVEGIFAARTQAPDMVLFESHMSGISPRDTARILKGDPATRQIQFIAIGGSPGEGVDAVLPKAFDQAQLGEVLAVCMAARLETDAEALD